MRNPLTKLIGVTVVFAWQRLASSSVITKLQWPLCEYIQAEEFSGAMFREFHVANAMHCAAAVLYTTGSTAYCYDSPRCLVGIGVTADDVFGGDENTPCRILETANVLSSSKSVYQLKEGETISMQSHEGYGTDNYGNGWDRKYLFIAPPNKKVRLELSNFVTEPNYDYVEIYDGGSLSGFLLASLDGNLASPLVYTSTGKFIFMRFQTDNTVTNPGFELDVEVTD